jgi:Anti-sigma factor NepR
MACAPRVCRDLWTVPQGVKRARALSSDQTSKAETDPAPAIGPATRRLQGETIGKVLREQYESVLAEPVPGELLALLDALERRETES